MDNLTQGDRYQHSDLPIAKLTRDAQLPAREIIACRLASHARGMGDLCSLVWSHFRTSHPAWEALDQSGWNEMDVLAFVLWDGFEMGGVDPRDLQPSALSAMLADCRQKDLPEYFDDWSIPIELSDRTRAVCIAYIDELVDILQQAANLRVQTTIARANEALDLKVWNTVRSALEPAE